jgi:hypothetical protein
MWADSDCDRLNDRYDDDPTIVELTKPYMKIENTTKKKWKPNLVYYMFGTMVGTMLAWRV